MYLRVRPPNTAIKTVHIAIVRKLD